MGCFKIMKITPNFSSDAKTIISLTATIENEKDLELLKRCFYTLATSSNPYTPQTTPPPPTVFIRSNTGKPDTGFINNSK
jgi:hypothetical protein